VNIRKAIPQDIDAMLALDRESATSSHLSERQYQELCTSTGSDCTRLTLVAALPKAGLAGFLIARYLAPEWELENIVVAAEARRKGVGKRLLEALVAAARETDSVAVYLEVRESNAAARALYKRQGFRETGRRKSYYTNPLEDAVLYSLTLD
jgi:[ribosomal protein S18]-alanine N-acetyltransferase